MGHTAFRAAVAFLAEDRALGRGADAGEAHVEESS